MLLALRAVPLVVPREHLLLAEETQAVLYGDTVSATPKALGLLLACGATEVDLFEVRGLQGLQVGDRGIVELDGQLEVAVVLHLP